MNKETLEKANELDLQIESLEYVENRVKEEGCTFAIPQGRWHSSLHLSIENEDRLRKYILRMVRSELKEFRKQMDALN
jgi:hypothetical protein